ncbi:MAG: hypothetical protein R2991_08550 [Thermoanaerobaculia bacterium]
MSRRIECLRALGAVAVLLCAAPAWASRPVELVSPAAGEVLPAGGTVWIEWAPAAGFEEIGWVDEWEAFLSLDGGATFPVRLTPHVDLDRRGVAATLPLLAGDDARLVLRFGDEGREVVAAEGAFSVVTAETVSSLPLARSFERGESVWIGTPETVFWASGSRRASAWRDVVPVSFDPAMSSGIELSLGREMAAVEEAPHHGSGRRAIPRSRTGPVPEPDARNDGADHGPRPARLDPLLQTSRRNE